MATGESKKTYGSPDGDLPQLISLSDIDIRVYKNVRSAIDNTDIERLSTDIDLNDLLQALVGCRQADGKVGLSCGFCRYEAIERLALRKVFDDYNKQMGFKTPTVPGYRHVSGRTKENGGLNDEGKPVDGWRVSTLVMQEGRRTFRELGPDWAEKFDAALAMYKVPVKLFKYKSPREAMLHNASENNNRTDTTLLDDLTRFEEFIESGMKQKEVASVMKLSESMMSHYRRVCNFLPDIREMIEQLADHPEFKDKPAEEIAKVKERFVAAADELERRLALQEEDPCVIRFRHVRDLSNTVMKKNKEDRPAPSLVLKMLVELTRLHANNSPTDEPTPDATSYEARIKTIAKGAQAADAEAPAQPTTETLPGKEGGAEVPPVQVGTPGPTPVAPTATAAPAAQAPAPQAAASTPAAGELHTTEDMELLQAANAGHAQHEKQAQIEAVNTALEGEVGDIDLDDLVGDITGGDEAASEDDLKTLDEGAGDKASGPKEVTRTKTQDAPVSRFKVIAPEKIEAQANAVMQDLHREGATIIERVNCLSQAQAFYFSCGLDAEANKIGEAHIIYVEQCEEYLRSLEEAALKYAPDNVKEAIRAAKPNAPELSLGNGNESSEAAA